MVDPLVRWQEAAPTQGGGDLVKVGTGAAKDYVLGLDQTKLLWLGGLVGVLVLFWAVRKVRRAVRRRRPPRVAEHLQAYASGTAAPAGNDDLIARRKAAAAGIVATSSTSEITGYEIIEQIEAVFVDGFRRAEEALEALKAVAAMKGANAVVRVKQERNAAGKCSASGDGVVVRKHVLAGSDRAAPPPSTEGSADVRQQPSVPQIHRPQGD